MVPGELTRPPTWSPGTLPSCRMAPRPKWQHQAYYIGLAAMTLRQQAGWKDSPDSVTNCRRYKISEAAVPWPGTEAAKSKTTTDAAVDTKGAW